MAEQHGLFDHGSAWRADALHIMTQRRQLRHRDPPGRNHDTQRSWRYAATHSVPTGHSRCRRRLCRPARRSQTCVRSRRHAYAGQSLSFSGTWPDLQPFRLRLNGIDSGSRVPVWDATNRVLTVFVAKGHVASVRLAAVHIAQDSRSVGYLGLDGGVQGGRQNPPRHSSNSCWTRLSRASCGRSLRSSA